MSHKNNDTRQGHSTSTVLTNRSKYITVISEQPDDDGKSSDARRKTPSNNRHVKGTRPMHNTTLTFEKHPSTPSFTTTTKDVFSGKKDVTFTLPPPRCPSLHNSQFQIGDKGQEERVARKGDYPPPSFVNSKEDRRSDVPRWQGEMKGTDMMSSLTYESNDSITDHSSTRHSSATNQKKVDVHSNPYKKTAKQEQFNIITGDVRKIKDREVYKKVSGNRILQSTRANTEEGIIG